jgi:hypothetical protein
MATGVTSEPVTFIRMMSVRKDAADDLMESPTKDATAAGAAFYSALSVNVSSMEY